MFVQLNYWQRWYKIFSKKYGTRLRKMGLRIKMESTSDAIVFVTSWRTLCSVSKLALRHPWWCRTSLTWRRQSRIDKINNLMNLQHHQPVLSCASKIMQEANSIGQSISTTCRLVLMFNTHKDWLTCKSCRSWRQTPSSNHNHSSAKLKNTRTNLPYF